ncbi:CDP-alcohol phosphatidyltransferase family protein [Clostridium beijerinckii]|uniref:CDP-diacylglycerol--glycerol-3-phosphate 3-phosphatidyltransferase n=1 Tax=Clostridium beijerinckii TaxID=1520 RepID=A0AAX0AWG0_CLOBE|nr:CDP-alcohol phosphatidyltransferase family protein [Clostridium beijerinckii]NRT86454.1 CDP-diacylglycerol--glycerol-3-phosphate 3-phosphatidyltransferase [Clostridium beijerinckii]NYC71886.1 CDP-diacylglycerol--glycerol-3-phosphate 3-phosphatidyltransferase [Clostridium beijerinckii]
MKIIVRYVPNSITITRIILSVLFANSIIEQFIYAKERNVNLSVLFLAICISDLLDGKIARKTNSTSIIGAKLDIFADLFYIILSYITLINIKILPIWYFGFVCFKFIEFIITSKYIKNIKKSDKSFVFDRAGRLVSATFLVIPGIVCIYRYIGDRNAIITINYIIYVTFIIGVYSSYSRIKLCFVKNELI